MRKGGKVMEKPKKFPISEVTHTEGVSITSIAEMFGYNQACDDWEKYHEWYVKTHCVRKENLPNIEEINKIYCQNCLYEECNEICDKMRIKITYAIAKRIGKEAQ